jgi:hypothetical protein
MMVEHSFLPRKKELSVTVDFSTKGNGAIMIKVLVAKKITSPPGHQGYQEDLS